ncbi:uncharacterized protein LOC126695872 [Quercus robur]|uniref:uncharacterized protein LOC126695872 n=1 Tax=Quercus robur TaxID=38942 RepID=UPI002162C1F7|nr:uncharacterized protein LOC126695872 [Quercus robur]
MALRWFNRLRKGSIHSFAELIQEFGGRFVTCSRVPQPVDALLSIKMRVGETLRSYASRYWELYNKIGGGNEKIAASTFRMGLPEDSELQESLTKRPLEDMRQLMRRIKEYKRLEDDRLQNKGKAPLLGRSRQGIIPARPKKDFKMQEPEAQIEGVNVAFKEPGQRAHHRAVSGTKRSSRAISKSRVSERVCSGLRRPGCRPGCSVEKESPPTTLGVIEVIHATPRSTAVAKGVLTVAYTEGESPEKKMKVGRLTIFFDEEDLEGTIQPHDDALVVTARISGFLVKRVMIDQGSEADVMYPDLFEGLGLKSQDLAKYDMPLVLFDGRVVVPKGQISLSVDMEGKEVIVTFIVVRSFSLYTTILGRL